MTAPGADVEVAVDARTGLTRNQFLIWLGQEAAPDRPIFNELSVFVIPAEVDVARFHRAFAHMLEETDALRTRVTRVHGQPVAEVLEHVAYESQVLDLSDQDDVDVALDAWALAQVDSVIDLSARPFESTLIELAPDRFAWGLLFHQLFTDATSMALVFQRVGDWYRHLSGSDEPPSTSAPRFDDYVRRQIDDSRTAGHRRRESYWAEKVSDPPEPVTFYGGRSAASRKSSRRQRVDRPLGPDLTSAVRKLASTPGVRFLSDDLSAFSVFSAALIAYLHRLSGHGRIVIGTPWQNRPRSFGSTVGLFMEQDPFEVEVDPGDTFRTLLEKVQAEALDVMRHLPYAAGNPGGRAYDVTFNYVKASLGSFADTPVDHRWYRPSVGDGSMQVQVHDMADSQDLTLSFDFDTEVFSDADREHAVAHYLVCLAALMTDLDATIGSVSLLTDSEREQLDRWNRTGRDYPRDATVVDLFEQQVIRRPDAVAVSCGDEQFTYVQLHERARDIAGQLRSAGVGPGVPVGVYLNRSLDLLAGLLGILSVGGTYVPLDPAFPHERLDYMLEDSGATVLLMQTQLVGGIDPADRAVVYIDRPALAPADGETPGGEALRPDPDGLAYVLYTSGSTGRPKGVEIGHRALMNFLCSMAREPGCTEDDRLLAVTTLSFDIAGLELFLPLIVGGRVEIASRASAADGRLLRAQLDTGAYTIMQATPVTWRMLLDAGWEGTTGLKALIGGEALPADLVQPLLDRTGSLWNMYGPTETTIWSSVQLISSATEEITVGRPIANTGFHVVDAQLQPVPVGVAGELLISGDGLARGYHNRPELTAETFVEVTPHGGGEPVRMYRTGDLVRLRADGQVVHLGRLDRQVKIRGFRIELGEIESVLTAHESIKQAVVVAHEAHTPAARLIAYLVPGEKPVPAPAELRAGLRESLPDYMVPQHFVPIAELPLTLNGKIDRRRLPVPDLTEGASNDSSPMSPMETRVAALFCEVLGLDSVSKDADFFDLGGQSILALRLVTKLGETFGVEVPLQELFEASTVADLSSRMSTLTSTTPELRTVELGGLDLEQELRDVWRSAVGAAPPDADAVVPLTDAQVAKLFSRVRQRFGVAAEGLSAISFRAEPTIAGLARVLRDALDPPRALIVPLQPNGTRPPLFLIHAGGGYVFFYRALAAHLGPDQPVHAIRAATRHDSNRNQFDRTASIEELAAEYIEEIKSVQPEGPYHLGGACFGGVVAFEMAQQLLTDGESMGSPVLLFDAFLAGEEEEEEQGGFASRTRAHVAWRLGAPKSAGTRELARLLATRAITHPTEILKLAALAFRSVFRRVRDALRGTALGRRLVRVRPDDTSPHLEQEQLDTMQEFLDASIELISKYEPTRYPGPAVLLKGAVGLDPEPMWTPWVGGGLDVHVTPGTHLDMMEEPWVEKTAELVRHALNTRRDG